MIGIDAQIAEHRAAVDDFASAARAIDAERWQTPRAPGAWSPAQIAEHLAVVYEYNRAVVAGTAPSPIPPLLRKPTQWLVRRAFVYPTLSAGRFTRKGRAPAIFQPSAAPRSADVVLSRLTAAVRGFEDDVLQETTIVHPIFGALTAVDWLRLQTIHVRHHRAQLPR